MTAIMQKPMAKTKKGKRIGVGVLLALLVLCLAIVGTVILCDLLADQTPSEEVLNAHRSEMLQQLQDRKGEYDEQTVVLSGTSRSVARRLSKALGAELRITKSGTFATLRLPEGVTIEDVCLNDDYLEDLPRMSINFYARISEVTDAESAEASPAPTVARPIYTVTDGSYELQTYLDYINLRADTKIRI